MKRQNLMKLFALLVAAMYMVVPAAFAEVAVPMLTNTAVTTIAVDDMVADLNDIALESDEADSAEAGMTPDSPFYGLDVAMDNIGLMFTFNKAKKAEKKLEIANERLKEAKMMAVANNLKAMEKAKIQHDAILLSAEEDIEAMNGNETEAIMSNIRIKSMLKVHNQEVADVEQELTLRVRGRFTVEQQGTLDAFIESMKGSSNSVEVKVQNKEEKIKAVVKRTRNLSDEEVDAEFENMDRAAAQEHLGDKAVDVIGQAKKSLESSDALIAKKQAEGKEVSYANDQRAEAEAILSEAEAALADGNVELATELAFKAKRMAVYAASGFSVEKLMNTPMRDDAEFMEMREQVRERMEERVQVRENINEANGSMIQVREEIREQIQERIDAGLNGSENGSSSEDSDGTNETSGNDSSLNTSVTGAVGGSSVGNSGNVIAE
ncbi:MAG: hypothetical protein GQ477_01605 [Nanohaloarchaea archaeon]|nr:hypothetical protein [Candidatus Nanohaloarchaea archaeon]